MSKATTPAIALTIAGSDSSGGAGIQADLKTFAALGVYGASVITAITAQNTRGVSAVHGVPMAMIEAQFKAVADDLNVSAVKTGMLGDEATVRCVARLLRGLGGVPVVVDPVMVATSGDVLLDPTAIDAVRHDLIGCATLITPNLLEAAALLDCSVAGDVGAMTDQARALLRFGCQAVLIKGGHGNGGDATDVLVSASLADVVRLTRPRLATRNTHGTGCTLSAAICAGLADGIVLADAVARAKDYVWSALQSAAMMRIGHGAGPVDHGFASRKPDGARSS